MPLRPQSVKALGTAAVLAADDVTGVGVADDIAIPFVLLAAAGAFAIGFAVGRTGARDCCCLGARYRCCPARRKYNARIDSPRPARTQAEPEEQPQPVPQTQTQTRERERRNNCLEQNPGAVICE